MCVRVWQGVCEGVAGCVEGVQGMWGVRGYVRVCKGKCGV